MQTITGKEALGRGRDLEILTVDLVAAGGRTTFSTVVCPKEQRTRPVDECAPCTDGTGPVNDPTARPGYFGCDAPAASSAGGQDAGAGVDRAVTTIMRRSVVAFRADVPVSSARAELLGRALAGAPVVDREGHPLGVLTYTELLRAAEVGTPTSALVGDVMLRRAFAVADTAPIAEVAAVMAAEGVTLVPVVARDGRVVGVVTALDLVEWLAAKEDRGARPLP